MIFPEFEILLQSVRLDDQKGAAAAAESIISGGAVNWDEVYERADFHGIKPQLLNLLDKLSSSRVPAHVKQKLEETVQSNLIRQLHYAAEFFRIREWLDNEGITVIPYKGFWLGEEMYGNLGGRESSDIDLFIYRHDLEKIKSIMAERGYIKQGSLTQLTDDYILNELAEYNFDSFSGDNCLSHIEFHWRSSMTFYRMDIRMEDLRSQVIKGMIQGRELQVFSPAADLLLVVMHHGGKETFFRLKQILDIAAIIRKSPELDTEWLFRQAERFHVSSLLFLGVRLASDLTGVSIPRGFTEHIKKRHIISMTENRMRLLARAAGRLRMYSGELDFWFFKIRSRDGLGTKAHLCRYTLRKIIAPRLVPEKWHHLFFNRKIRRYSAV